MRRGVTLLEVLVVVGILAVLVGLLLPVIQKVREVAGVTRSSNNLRQIALAVSQFATDHESRLPRLTPRENGEQVFIAALPYLEQTPLYSWLTGQIPITAGSPDNVVNQTVRVYLNPLDPSTLDVPSNYVTGVSVTSYACNAQVFAGRPQLPKSIPDGLAQTIFFTEHYGWRCGGVQFYYRDESSTSRLAASFPSGRPSFADGGPRIQKGRNPGDFYPLPLGSPAVSTAPEGVTFQLRPASADCDPRLPNSSTTRGLQVALGDGSVRVLSPGITPAVFWGAVTPAGGEATQLE
jgi:prepilin-type N-terminal cleavage/methylation domain-containing protein